MFECFITYAVSSSQQSVPISIITPSYIYGSIPLFFSFYYMYLISYVLFSIDPHLSV